MPPASLWLLRVTVPAALKQSRAGGQSATSPGDPADAVGWSGIFSQRGFLLLCSWVQLKRVLYSQLLPAPAGKVRPVLSHAPSIRASRALPFTDSQSRGKTSWGITSSPPGRCRTKGGSAPAEPRGVPRCSPARSRYSQRGFQINDTRRSYLNNTGSKMVPLIVSSILKKIPKGSLLQYLCVVRDICIQKPLFLFL